MNEICDPFACPAGSTQVGVVPNCSASQCVRECDVDDYCGSYGSFTELGGPLINFDGLTDRGDTFSGPVFSASSQFCYDYYITGYFQVDSEGSSDSYHVGLRSTEETSYDAVFCSLSSNNFGQLPLFHPSPLQDGASLPRADLQGHSGNVGVEAFIYDFGRNTCSGGAAINDLNGQLTLGVAYRRANFIQNETDDQICQR